MSEAASDGEVDLQPVQSTGQQVKDQLQKLATSRGKARKPLPGEQELASSFGVSRATVRKALDALLEEGLLEKVVGAKGATYRPSDLARAQVTNKVPNFGQARRLLEEAALELFGERGFAGASTRSIADRAGVSEALIYRHFGSKTGLFERSVIDPIRSFINGYVERWDEIYSHEPMSEESVRDYVTGLYRIMRKNRPGIIALLSEDSFSGSGSSHQRHPLFGEVIGIFDDVTLKALERRGYSRPNPEITLRASIALVVGMALLDDFLFGSTEAQARQESAVIDELVSLIVGGVR